MGIFARSWALTKMSFKVMTADKELIIYPLVGGIVSLLFMATMLFPTIITGYLANNSTAWSILDYVIIYIVYFGLSLITITVNTCVVYTVKTRLEGGNATLATSFAFSLKRLHRIIVWAAISATVGLILRIIENSGRRSGKGAALLATLMSRMLGAVWGIITVFVVPCMVYEDIGPIQAIKKSIEILKRTWGELLVQHVGVGLVQAVFVVVGMLLGGISAVLVSPFGVIPILSIIIMTVIYIVGISLVFGVLDTVYRTAVFHYALSGKAPKGFDEAVLRDAFGPKTT